MKPLTTSEKRDLINLRRIVKLLDEVLSLTGDETLFLTARVGTIDPIQDNALRARLAAANVLCDFHDTSAVITNPPHQIRRV